MQILVSGITGSIGAKLAPRLAAAGHEVRGMSRQPALETSHEGAGPPEIPVIAADAVSGEGLDAALAGIEVAYFLIHSMEAEAAGRFSELERLAAENFVSAARSAGVRRIVYLGGLMPTEGPASRHLASRLAVERILLEATAESVALRASIVIGARSRSFRLLVRLVERVPILLIPAWRDYRTAPIDERDVIAYLARAATAELPSGQSLDIAGPQVVTYGQLIERIRDQMLVARPVINIPYVSATPIASRISAMITGEDHGLIGPLMEGLTGDLLPRDDHATKLLAVRRHSLDAAIERALREWEEIEPLRAR